MTGFFQEVLDRVQIDEVRQGAELAIARELAAGIRLMALVRACSVATSRRARRRRFALDGHQVAVVNLGDDGFRAVDAICSHEHYFLDEGEVDVDDETIECPKHGSTFDLNTGRPPERFPRTRRWRCTT